MLLVVKQHTSRLDLVAHLGYHLRNQTVEVARLDGIKLRQCGLSENRFGFTLKTNVKTLFEFYYIRHCYEMKWLYGKIKFVAAGIMAQMRGRGAADWVCRSLLFITFASVSLCLVITTRPKSNAKMYKPFVFFGLIMKFFFNCPSMAVLIIVNAAAVSAQTPDCYATRADVATVRLTAAGRLHDRPVVDLGSGQELDLSFDMIDADVRTLYYSFALCNADWSPSDLLEIEYVAGINRFYGAESAALSFNTTTDYVHYDLTVGTDALRCGYRAVRSVRGNSLFLT